jgi:Ca2+-binding EF-hand superfamily protein
MGNQQINYTEFLCAAISVKKILTKEHLTAMFKQFDTDVPGFITVQNIIEAMHKFSHHISAHEIYEIMNKHAFANPNQINFE